MSSQYSLYLVSCMIKQSVSMMQKRIMFQVVLHSIDIQNTQPISHVCLGARNYVLPIHGHSVNHDKWKGDKISKISCWIRAYFTLVMRLTTAPATGHTKI